jgi:hypothetical protein
MTMNRMMTIICAVMMAWALGCLAEDVMKQRSSELSSSSQEQGQPARGDLKMLLLVTEPINTFEPEIIIKSIDHFIKRGFKGEGGICFVS